MLTKELLEILPNLEKNLELEEITIIIAKNGFIIKLERYSKLIIANDKKELITIISNLC